MSEELIDALLQALAGTKDHDRAWSIVDGLRRDLLDSPELGAELARRAARAEPVEEEPVEHIALESLLTGARMDRENGGRNGKLFLAAVEGAVQSLAHHGDLTLPGAVALAGCYHRAGLPPPEALTEGGWTQAVLDADPETAPDFGSVLDELRDQADGDAFAVHAELNNILATVPPAMRQPVIAEVLGRAEPIYDQVGVYWLLDPVEDVRRASAEAFLRRVGAGKLDAVTAARLIGLRSWLPADAARDAVDATITEAMRREVVGGAGEEPWKLQRILASLPDGVGAQSIAITAQSRARRRGVAVLLLKQSLGIKDAYVISCANASEQNRVVAGITEKVEMFAVSPEYLQFALSDALAENIAIGAPPAHGFVDVGAACGFEGLHPAPRDVAAWITHCDPEESLARVSPQKFGRLVSSSVAYAEELEMAQSWYEDRAELEERMAGAKTLQGRERAVWRHLEVRRDWWAKIFARTAATLKSEARREVWQAFAATARGLSRGDPLGKIPMARSIVERSVAAPSAAWEGLVSELEASPGDISAENALLPSGSDSDVEFEFLVPEKKGELKRLLKSTGAEMTPDWIDGYVAALVAAPRMVRPSKWVGELLERAGNFKNEEQMQRLLDLVMLRYNAANSETVDAEAVRSRLADMNGGRFRDWGLGFHVAVSSHKREWSGRSLKKEDKAMLGLFADVIAGRAEANELKKLVPAWLERRHLLRS